MVGDRLWGSLPAADKAQPPSLPTDASSVAQMLDDLLQPQIMDTIEVRCPWLGVGRRRDTQWVPSQNVPVEVQKTWFEDVITASTELRKIALGLRVMLEHFHAAASPLNLSECLDAVGRAARQLVGGRRARVFLVRQADNGTQYLWTEAPRERAEPGRTKREVRLPMPTYIPDDDLVQSPGAKSAMHQRVMRATAQLGHAPGFVGLAAMSHKCVRVRGGRAKDHPAINKAIDRPLSDSAPVLVCPIMVMEEVTRAVDADGGDEPTYASFKLPRLVGVVEVCGKAMKPAKSADGVVGDDRPATASTASTNATNDGQSSASVAHDATNAARPGFQGSFRSMLKHKANKPHSMRFGGVGTEAHDDVARKAAAEDKKQSEAVKSHRAAGLHEGGGLVFADDEAKGDDAGDVGAHEALPPPGHGDFTREDEWLLSVFAYHTGVVLRNAESHTELSNLRVCACCDRVVGAGSLTP